MFIPMYFDEDLSNRVPPPMAGRSSNDWLNLCPINLDKDLTGKQITELANYCDGFFYP